MVNDEATVARLLPEPEDGTRLVVQVDENENEYQVIWRDDAEAKSWGSSHEDERWFADAGSDPMALYQHLKYAEKVWRLDGAPIANFTGIYDADGED